MVTLTEDLPQKGLLKGQMETIVEGLAPGDYEVDFSGLDGKTYTTTAVSEKAPIGLLHEPVTA